MLNNDENFDAYRVIELMEKKNDMLLKLYELTLSQAKAINDENVEVLVEDTDKKQYIINIIDEMDQECKLKMDSFNAAKLKTINCIDNEYIEKLNSLLDKNFAIIKKINEEEQKNKIAAEELLKKLAEQLKTTSNNKKVAKEYQQGGLFDPPSQYIDKKY